MGIFDFLTGKKSDKTDQVQNSGAESAAVSTPATPASEPETPAAPAETPASEPTGTETPQ